MRAHKRTVSIAAVIVAALAGSCSRRPHTSSHFGTANRTFFDRQSRAAHDGSAQGLDSEEASVIHQQYRQSLGKRGAQTPADPKSSVLILQDGEREAPSRK